MKEEDLKAGAAGVVIPVLEEKLDLATRAVDVGGIRIRKIVHTEEVPVEQALSSQLVEVSRVPVGRDVDGPVAVRQEGNVTVFPVVMERLVVVKQLVLVEEIHVTRNNRVVQSSQTIPLRREEVIVERQDASGEWRSEAAIPGLSENERTTARR